MNLLKIGKRLFFSIIIIIVIGLSYKGVTYFINYFEEKFLLDKQKTIELYEKKIDVLNQNGILLTNKIKVLDYQVDSLKRLKSKIYIKYAEKVNVIYDANATEHAMWMDSILVKLKDFKTR